MLYANAVNWFNRSQQQGSAPSWSLIGNERKPKAFFPWHTFCCGCQWHRGSESQMTAASRSQRSGLGGHSLCSKKQEWWEGEGWGELCPSLLAWWVTEGSGAWPPCGGPWGPEWKEFWGLLSSLQMPTAWREYCRDGLTQRCLAGPIHSLCRLLGRPDASTNECRCVQDTSFQRSKVCSVGTVLEPEWLLVHMEVEKILFLWAFLGPLFLVASLWCCCIKYLALKIWVTFHHNSGSWPWALSVSPEGVLRNSQSLDTWPVISDSLEMSPGMSIF